MIYRIEVEFKKLKELDFDKFSMSCSTIEVDEYSLDFCSTEVYDHDNTINVLMKEVEWSNEVIEIEKIIKSPDGHRIHPIISWMNYDGRELSDEEIGEFLEYKELTLIPLYNIDLDWVYKKKDGVYIGFINKLPMFFIYHDIEEGDLFNPREETYRLCYNGLILSKDPNKGWLEGNTEFYLENSDELYSGLSLEECMRRALDVLNTK